MRNTYGFRFLASPSNPRNDTWIGQAFGLSYLNSQPGNSYLFRFKPYWAMDSRLYPGPMLADRGTKTGGENRGTVYSQREASKEAIPIVHTTEYAIRRRLEALFSRNYHADIQSATALVLEHLSAETDRLESRVDWSVLARRVEERQNTLVILGKMGHRHQIRQEAITIAEMLLGHLRRHNNPDAIISQGTLARLDDRLHTAWYTTHSHRAEMLRNAITLKVDLAERNIRQGASKYTGESTAFRPNVVHDAIENTMFFGERPDIYGWVSPVSKLATAPTKEGHLYTHLSFGTDEDSYGWIGGAILGTTDDKVGVIYPDFVMAKGKEGLDAISSRPILVETKDAMHGVVDQTVVRADGIKSTEASRYPADVVRVDRQKGSQATVDRDVTRAYGAGTQQARYDLQQFERVEYGGFSALEVFHHQFFHGPQENPKSAMIVDELLRTEFEAKNARVDRDDTTVEIMPKTSRALWAEIVRGEKMPKSTWIGDFDTIRVDEKSRQTGWTPDIHIEKVENDARNVRIIWDASKKLEKQSKDIRDADFVDVKLDILPAESWILEEASVKVDLIEKIAKYMQFLNGFSLESKNSLIEEFRSQLADKDAMISRITEYQRANMGWKEEWTDLEAFIPGYDLLQKADKESIVVPMKGDNLLADKAIIDSILLRLLNFDRAPDTDAIIISQSVADRLQDQRIGLEGGYLNAEKDLSKLRGIIESQLTAEQRDPQRPAYIPVEGYILVTDDSEWNDIWDRYSPGLDVIDVPDSDYDYTQLQNQVYDAETGVPFKPLGLTNKPDVKIRYPLHHPVPSNAEIGIGQVIVDNYVLMDTILAVESLKNRNRLRFAGMPAEKTMREMLAKLFAWIEQAAPGNDEYHRAFRFVRWYSETVVMQLSTHLLQRTYDAWLSSIHRNGDLGIPYTATGWRYLSNASILQTQDTSASLVFNQPNYVDGEITVRGYFDNPYREGTMELKVDGTTVSQLTTSDNGAFTLKAELPAGDHRFEIVFNGASGRVSLSSLEITGCVFVGATTVADDSDTNGLKACTTLVQMLLVYFERHHGNGKIKGTMAIKQRGLWNQT